MDPTHNALGRITPREVALIVDDRKGTRPIQRREPSPEMLGAEALVASALQRGDYRTAEQLMDSPAYTGKPAPKPQPKATPTVDDLIKRVYGDAGRPVTLESLCRKIHGCSLEEFAKRKADTQADPALPPKRKRKKRGAPNPEDKGYDAALTPSTWTLAFDPHPVIPVSWR